MMSKLFNASLQEIEKYLHACAIPHRTWKLYKTNAMFIPYHNTHWCYPIQTPRVMNLIFWTHKYYYNWHDQCIRAAKISSWGKNTFVIKTKHNIIVVIMHSLIDHYVVRLFVFYAWRWTLKIVWKKKSLRLGIEECIAERLTVMFLKLCGSRCEMCWKLSSIHEKKQPHFALIHSKHFSNI